jgi:hypothetical protein
VRPGDDDDYQPQPLAAIPFLIYGLSLHAAHAHTRACIQRVWTRTRACTHAHTKTDSDSLDSSFRDLLAKNAVITITASASEYKGKKQCNSNVPHTIRLLEGSTSAPAPPRFAEEKMDVAEEAIGPPVAEEEKEAEMAPATWQCAICHATILDEQLSVGCDGHCKGWVHALCAGLTPQQADALSSYKCPGCSLALAASTKPKKCKRMVRLTHDFLPFPLSTHPPSSYVLHPTG